MPTYPIPHTSQFLNVKSIFSATWNTAGDGLYTFNENVEIMPLEENTVYFIQGIEISGDIDHNDFQAALNVNPQLFLKTRIGKRIELARSIAITQFTDDKKLEFFIKNQKKNNFLDGQFTGKLSQTADLIGKEEITINISFTIYAINDKIFNEAFRDSVKMSFSNKIGRG